jgi:cardiolipin synthase
LRLVFVPFIVINLVDGNYLWALGLFVAAGISDGLDGLLARLLKQQTVLGQYLDPIADKLLLSTLFLVLSITHKIAWKFTVLVFCRDLFILVACAVLYAVVGFREFRPSVYGKANTLAQVTAVFFVLLYQVNQARWIHALSHVLLWAVFALTLISGIHYAVRAGQQMRAGDRARPTAVR